MKLYVTMSQDYQFCLQRREAQTNNQPLGRFTPVNPYQLNFTKAQLDMRRKVEILKYSANKSSSQTNNMTKKELFARLVKDGLSRSKSVIGSNNIEECDADKVMPRPSSSSNVPGPVTYLYEDKNVPLYNYSDFNTRTYPDFVPTDNNSWQFVVKSNTLVSENGSAALYYLIINNKIEKRRYTYNIATPVALTIEGRIPPAYSPPSGFDGNITVNISSASLSVYYTGVIAVVPASNVDLKIKFKIPTSNTGTEGIKFAVTQFLGNLQFENIALYTEPTYVYRFDLTSDLSASASGITLNMALIGNPDNIANSALGCNIIEKPNSVNAGASITGTGI